MVAAEPPAAVAIPDHAVRRLRCHHLRQHYLAHHHPLHLAEHQQWPRRLPKRQWRWWAVQPLQPRHRHYQQQHHHHYHRHCQYQQQRQQPPPPSSQPLPAPWQRDPPPCGAAAARWARTANEPATERTKLAAPSKPGENVSPSQSAICHVSKKKASKIMRRVLFLVCKCASATVRSTPDPVAHGHCTVQ